MGHNRAKKAALPPLPNKEALYKEMTSLGLPAKSAAKMVAIYSLYVKTGATYHTLAVQHGISAERVRVLIAKTAVWIKGAHYWQRERA